MRPRLLALSSGVLLMTTACSASCVGVPCTTVGPPFGLTFDMTALGDPPRPVDDPLVADYCADDACQGTYVRLFTADPAVTGGSDMTSAFIFDLDMTATPTAHLRLHDEGGPVTHEASAPVAARAVSSDVNGPRCTAEGHWGAVRVGADGSLTDVTATTPLPESLQPR